MNEAFEGLLASGAITGASYGVKRWGSASLMSHSGLANLQEKTPIGPTSQFRIASVTKTFVAVAIMKLVETGCLDLEDSVNQHVDRFPKGDAITIRHLLSHTSGLKNWYETSPQEPASENWLMEARADQVLATGNDLFRFEPGSAHWYSNSGYILLGEIIRKVSGMSWMTYLETSVLDPLGLTRTTIENAGTSHPDWIEGYAIDRDVSGSFVQTDFSFMPGAAGAMRSTVDDLLDWSEALWSGRVLRAETVSAMTRMGILNDGTPIDQDSYFPLEFGDRPPPPPNMQKAGWGLGVSLFKSRGRQIVWHSGGIAGFNSIWLNIPGERLSVVMLSNTENGAVDPFDKTLEAMVA